MMTALMSKNFDYRAILTSLRMDFGAQVIQIAIISNHMSGKDSRIRQIKVYSRARFTNIAILITVINASTK